MEIKSLFLIEFGEARASPLNFLLNRKHRSKAQTALDEIKELMNCILPILWNTGGVPDDRRFDKK
jgi:hypothetical protein